tara:strand:- start:26 stop:1261 length:1236 start_codon:yes stop_codon:yes gene_type:complete
MGFAGDLGLDNTLVQDAIASQNNESASVVLNNGVIQGRKSGPERRADQKRIRDDRNNENKPTNKEESTTYKPSKRNLRKINGGRVLQYPIDIDINLQDYFEMQVFKYRSAGRLPDLTDSTEEQLGSDSKMAGYNRRYNRQNFRLEELQSTIQIPIPNSLKDNNTVGWGPEEISGVMGQLGGPTMEKLFGDNENIDGLLGGGIDAAKKTFANADKLFGTTGPLKQFRRRAALNLIAQAAGTIGVNIDVDQAVTRINGTIINPNMELLFSGPSLRSFTFTIRFTPRNPEESAQIRMIIRVLKQHSAVKRNPKINSTEVYANDVGSNFLLGTPDVFKLRYIKAKTQKDIKGLNKFKTCALKSVSVDYTGEAARFAAYDEDSQPVTTLVTLNFQELVPIYDEDYHEFTTDDDVGL